MSIDARRRSAGFTLLEVLMVSVLAGLGSLLAVSLLGTTDDLSYDSRMRMRASASYREGHAAIAARLVNAAVDSLGGFDVNGLSTHPTFRTVTGTSGAAPALSPPWELYYERVTSDLDGAPAGRIVVRPVGAASAQTLVEPVREGSFEVRQEGRSVVVRFEILEAVKGGEVIGLEGETVVSLRN